MAYQLRQEVKRYLKPGTTYDPLRQPLYDAVRFSAQIAAGTNTAFFSTPIGQGTGIAAGAKTLLDTNMRLAGQLPTDHVFECWSPRAVVAFDNVMSAQLPLVAQRAEVLNDLLYRTRLSISIVTQRKLDCPVFFLPAGAGAVWSGQGFQAAAANFTTEIVTNGTPVQTAALRLDPFPIVIPPQQTFSVEMVNDTAVPEAALAAGVGGFTVWIVLDGILHRPALP